MRVLDSMTDRYLADPLLSSEGRTGGGLQITLVSIRTPIHSRTHNTLAHFYTAFAPMAGKLVHNVSTFM